MKGGATFPPDPLYGSLCGDPHREKTIPDVHAFEQEDKHQ
jgi:hypothetical protein